MDCQTACFPVYKIESSLLSVVNTTDHGIQIPTLVQYSQSSVLLSLTVDSDLVDNERYSANISTVSAEGEEDYSVTVEFGNTLAKASIIINYLPLINPAYNFAQIRMMFSQ